MCRDFKGSTGTGREKRLDLYLKQNRGQAEVVRALEWQGEHLRLLDQTKLPLTVEYIECKSYSEVAHAIRSMQVRGAPAIGVAAAFAVVLAAKQFLRSGSGVDRVIEGEPDFLFNGTYRGRFLEFLYYAIEELSQTRPTAVNLFWALERMRHKLEASARKTPVQITQVLEQEAQVIWAEDRAMNQRISIHGLTLIPQGARILTHCNAGALATAGYGTALGIIRAAHEAGRKIAVWVDETRPLLQGARLTAWELAEENIPATLIADNMAGYLMQQGKVDMVIVGADRIAANGDVANKIGTYSLAVLARVHQLPFYVAAPWSTVDLSLSSGHEIPIEQREAREVRELYGQQVAPLEIPVYNPAFDVTPGELITALVTDRGIINPSYTENLCKLA